jgi:hypothetical protein
VYDLKNAGPRSRFMVIGESPMIISNCTQSTGHDILMKALRILYTIIENNNWTPDQFYFMIPDYHDELDPCTKNIKDSEMLDVLKEVQDVLNEEISGLIPIKFESKKVQSFWGAKSD